MKKQIIFRYSRVKTPPKFKKKANLFLYSARDRFGMELTTLALKPQNMLSVSQFFTAISKFFLKVERFRKESMNETQITYQGMHGKILFLKS